MCNTKLTADYEKSQLEKLFLSYFLQCHSKLKKDMNINLKIIPAVLLTFSLNLSLLSTPVLAQTNATSSPGLNSGQRLATVKTRALSEIDKRLASLNAALGRILASTKLSAADKANFTSQIQTNITNLKTLHAKIEADTDLTTLKADAKSIFADFRIYAVFLPQTHLLAAADTMGMTADKLASLSAKLQTKIDQSKQAGKDVTALQNLLSDLNSKVADAKGLYTVVESEVAPLSPAGYPGNLPILQDARSKIKAGAADLKTAWQDAKQIREGLTTTATKHSP